MINKKTLTIAAVILVIVIIYINREALGKMIGLSPRSGDGKIDPNKLDIATVPLSEVQATIDALLKAQADGMVDGTTDSKEFENIQKKIQILKLEQKTNVKFTQALLTELMKLSIVELMELNMMSNAELLEYANAWNIEHSGTDEDINIFAGTPMW